MTLSKVAIYATGGSGHQGATLFRDTSIASFTLEFSADFLRVQLGALLDGIRPEIRQFMEYPDRARSIVHTGQMPSNLLSYRIASVGTTRPADCA